MELDMQDCVPKFPVLIGTLPGDEEKRVGFRERFERSGALDFFHPLFVEGYHVNPGKTGCFLTLQRCVRIAKAEDWPLFVYMEDDNEWIGDFRERWPLVARFLWKHKDNGEVWDIFNGSLTCSDTQNRSPRCLVLDYEASIVRCRGLCTNMLVIPRRHYDTFSNLSLQRLDHYHGCIDVFLPCEMRRMISSVPFLCRQSPSFSKLQNKLVDYSPSYRTSEQWIMENLYGGCIRSMRPTTLASIPLDINVRDGRENPHHTTIVSAFYDFSSLNAESAGKIHLHSREFYMERFRDKWSWNFPMIVYGDDEEIRNAFLSHRASLNLSHLSEYVTLPIRDLPMWKTYHDQVVRNREAYWPTRDARAPVESHLVTNAKMDFVADAIRRNPFGTETVTWFDAGYRSQAGPFSFEMVDAATRRCDRQHVYVTRLNVVHHAYRSRIHWKELFMRYPYLVVGGFVVYGVEAAPFVIDLIRWTFEQMTIGGVGHGEEACFLHALAQLEQLPKPLSDTLENFHRKYSLQTHHSLIQCAYGDYADAVFNMAYPDRLQNIEYIVRVICARLLQYEQFSSASNTIGCLLSNTAQSSPETTHFITTKLRPFYFEKYPQIAESIMAATL